MITPIQAGDYLTREETGDMVLLTKVAWEMGQRYHSNVFVRKSNVTYIVSTTVGTVLHLVGGDTLEVIEKMDDVAARLA